MPSVMRMTDSVQGGFAARLMRRMTAGDGVPTVDFSQPAGEEALVGADSISWRIFKNPVALFIGGVTAVLLEFGEPRVRSGVWDHSTFRTDPVTRLKRTGLAAMVTVYGARSVAERMIAGVRRMHGKVVGETPTGDPYEANDVELLNWVQATASYGFLEAYCAFATRLTPAERDRFYAEGAGAAALYGALGAPRSVTEQEAQFAAMLPKLEASDIVFEFLEIMQSAPVLPRPLRGVQGLFVRAAVEILPEPVRAVLTLGPRWRLKPWEVPLVHAAGRIAERVQIAGTPAVEACQRLGLPANYLFRRD